MEVKLKQNFFGPDGRLYRKTNSGTTTVPDKFKDKLPTSSVIVSEAPPPAPEPEPEVKAKIKV